MPEHPVPDLATKNCRLPFRGSIQSSSWDPSLSYRNSGPVTVRSVLGYMISLVPSRLLQRYVDRRAFWSFRDFQVPPPPPSTSTQSSPLIHLFLLSVPTSTFISIVTARQTDSAGLKQQVAGPFYAPFSLSAANNKSLCFFFSLRSSFL